MLKKTLFFIKTIIVSLLWSIVYFTCLRFVFTFFWNFDIFYIEYWRIISDFWDGGGVLKTGKDITLIFAILFAIPVWLFLLIVLVRFNYTRIILFPIKMYDRHTLKNYDPNDSRIVIKNLSTKKEKVSIDDMINEKLKQMKEDKSSKKGLESEKIRSNIQEKIKNKK